MSVSCSLVVIGWERVDLLALLYVMFSYVFFSFPYGVLTVLGQVRCGTWLYRFLTFALLLSLLCVNRFTIGSQFNSLNISADVVLKSECNIIRAAHF